MQSQEYLPNGLQLLQDDRFFKLGQDSMMLSAFVRIGRKARVLDLCCGTGVLALLCHRSDLTITGLELQPGPLELFRQSIALNGLHNVTALQGDLRKITSIFPAGSMDYVVCNPPYFASGSGKSAADAAHETARQDDTADIGEVAAAIAHVLGTGGKCAIVFRPERLSTLLRELDRRRLIPKRMRFVHGRANLSPSAVLLECRKDSKDGLTVEPPLIINNL